MNKLRNNIRVKYGVFLLLLMFLNPLFVFPQIFTEQDVGFLQWTSVEADWGDYDNDRDLDVIIMGTAGVDYNPVTALYRNDGTGNFTVVNAGFIKAKYGKVEWGDYDNDNDLDLLLIGKDSTDTHHSKIYRNNGNGTFTDIAAGILPIYYGTAHWCDMDTDGDLDVFINGYFYNTWISVVFRNDGNNQFTYRDLGFPGMVATEADWGDYDNDGDQDLVLAGVDIDYNKKTKLFRNDGNEVFTDIPAGLAGLTDGTVIWGDYDTDGDLDIFLSGMDDFNGYTNILYKNEGNDVFTDAEAGLFGVYRTSAEWGDCDNDGDPDLAYTGEYFDLEWNDSSVVYINNGNDQFTGLGGGFPDVEGSLSWVDYDNDSDLDLFLAGDYYIGNLQYQYVTKMYRNEIPVANSIPLIPGGLLAFQDSTSNTVYFSWNQASDVETPDATLTYNMMLGTTPQGSDIIPPMSDTGTGYRKITGRGNMEFNTHVDIELPYGTYYWRVQSVDNAWAGSPFSPVDSFSVMPLAYFSASDTNICVFDTVVFNFIGNASDQAVFDWDFAGGSIVSGNLSGPFTVSFSNPGLASVSLTIQDGGFTSGTITTDVIVNSMPEANAGNDTSLCLNESINISAAVFSGTPPYQYDWNNGSTEQEFILAPSADSLLVLTVTDENGCSATDEIMVFVISPFDQQEICLVTVDSVTGKNKIVWERTTNQGIESYIVYKEVATGIFNWIGSVDADSLSTFIDYSSQPAVHSDKYKIAVVDSCGNESQKSFYHYTVNMGITQGATQSTFILDWNPYEVEGGGLVPDKYYIYRGTTLSGMELYDSVSGSFTNYNEVNVTQNYYYGIVTVLPEICVATNSQFNTDTYGHSVSNIRDLDLDGIETLSEKGNISVFPNPFTERTFVYLEGNQNNPILVRIEDLTGHTILNYYTIAESGLLELDVYSINPGCYILEIQGNRYYRAKLIKQ